MSCGTATILLSALLAGVMSGVLALGDNTFDIYAETRIKYPGGNALNVAVLARRLGERTAYLGCVGEDPAGLCLLTILEQERVDSSRTRIRAGRTARALIGHINGERLFLGADHGVRSEYGLHGEDYRYVAAHALMHSSIHGEIERYLPDCAGRPHLFRSTFPTAGTMRCSSACCRS